MKKFTMICLAGLLSTSAFAQNGRIKVATPDQAKGMTYHQKMEQLMYDDFSTDPIVKVRNYVEQNNQDIIPNGRVAAVNPVTMGRASNVYTCLRPEQNQVYANDSLGIVAYIHRHDIAIWGGGNGELRYDLSTDKGATFTNDIGQAGGLSINDEYLRPARYPNITGYNPNSSANPFDAVLPYSAPTLNSSPDWDGYVTGVCTVTGGDAVCTETYSLLASGTLLQGGLTQGADGEFWSVDWRYSGGATTGELLINKGNWNSGTSDVDWVRADSVTPTHNMAFGGAWIGPNIEFSLDGNTAWIGFLGDLDNGSGLDSTLKPCFIKSTDGGTTWGTPIEVDLSTFSWITDSLQQVWVMDTISNTPAANGKPTTSFDFDITVDRDGNPHMFTVIGSLGSGSEYSIAGYAKFAADIYSTDGGATWEVAYLSPVLTLRGSFGGGSQPITMDNQCQVSRDNDGSHIFFSWADSDTATVTGNASGVGFGTTDNNLPNLRIASLRIDDKFQTYPKLVSDLDAVWEGAILFPNMAPQVMWDNTNMNYNLPIVVAKMLNNDALQTTEFYYFGNDAEIADADYCNPDSMNLLWDNFGYLGASPTCGAVVIATDPTVSNNWDFTVAPNPFVNELSVYFELEKATDVKFSMVDLTGKQIFSYESGKLNAGSHKLPLASSVYNTLPAGVYFLTGDYGFGAVTKKVVKVD